MCAIIDASVAGRVFKVPTHDDFAPLWEWIENRGGKLVFGGKLARELDEIAHVKRLLRRLWEAGQARQIPADKINLEHRVVRRMSLCVSNDIHIIAIARASGARILCTNDDNLQMDFKNLKLVSKPKGRIYKNASHKELLHHDKSCRGRKD